MGLFSRFFGGKGKGNGRGSGKNETLVADVLEGVIERAGFDLSFEIDSNDENVNVEFSGDDEKILVDKDGLLLDSLQFFVKRVIQHQVPGERVDVNFDVDGFRERANQDLIALADKLKGIALEKRKSVYFRALPPKDRKVIHQHLAEDGRVKSRSIGDGLYKKIKIYPTNSKKEESGNKETVVSN